MKYCPQCGSEFRDGVERCEDDEVELVSAEEMRERGLPLPGERDTRRFVRLDSAEDPLTAEQLVAALTEAKIPAFARPRRAGSVDGLTTASSGPWWEIVIPEQHMERAREVVAKQRAQIEASADEAGRAAEEEEAELERQGVKPG